MKWCVKFPLVKHPGSHLNSHAAYIYNCGRMAFSMILANGDNECVQTKGLLLGKQYSSATRFSKFYFAFFISPRYFFFLPFEIASISFPTATAVIDSITEPYNILALIMFGQVKHPGIAPQLACSL